MSNSTTTKPENVTVLPLTFKVGKDSTQTETPAVNLATFVSEMGGILRKYPQAFTLRVLGHDLNIPAETASNSPLHRTFAGLKQLTKIVFAGQESEQVIKGVNEKLILSSFQAVGFKFTSFTKASVNEAVNLWWANKRAKIDAIKVSTRQANSRLIAETTAIKEVVKEQRVALAADLTGLKIAATRTAKALIMLPESK